MEGQMGKKKKTGPLIIFLIVLAGLVWAYFYFFKGKTQETIIDDKIIEEEAAPAPEEAAPAPAPEEPAPTDGDSTGEPTGQ